MLARHVLPLNATHAHALNTPPWSRGAAKIRGRFARLSGKATHLLLMAGVSSVGPRGVAATKKALLVSLGISAVLVACGSNHGSQGNDSEVAASRSGATFCAWLASMKPAPSFTSEAEAIRAAAPLAPTSLRDSVHIMLLAYEQLQDTEDGTFSELQVVLAHSAQLQQAMSAIDDYTLRSCGFHAAAVLPG